MSERSRTWGGAPNRWTPTPAAPDLTPWGPSAPAPPRTAPGGWVAEWPAEPDRVEPGDGRHAFDRDAALTPIFTALRRGGRRRPRPGAPPLRLAPEPVERHRGDPPTAPIPVVPALHALDPYPSGGYSASSVDPYAPAGYPPAPGEQYGAGGYSAASVDPYASRGHRYPADRVVDAYAPSGPYSAAPPPSRAETTAVWPRIDGALSHLPSAHLPSAHTPVTDTGRHHRRLAPAGW